VRAFYDIEKMWAGTTTGTKSQSTTSEIHKRDWGMLGIAPAPFPFRLGL